MICLHKFFIRASLALGLMMLLFKICTQIKSASGSWYLALHWVHHRKHGQLLKENATINYNKKQTVHSQALQHSWAAFTTKIPPNWRGNSNLSPQGELLSRSPLLGDKGTLWSPSSHPEQTILAQTSPHLEKPLRKKCCYVPKTIQNESRCTSGRAGTREAAKMCAHNLNSSLNSPNTMRRIPEN